MIGDFRLTIVDWSKTRRGAYLSQASGLGVEPVFFVVSPVKGEITLRDSHRRGTMSFITPFKAG